jgi:serine/threonine protein kinase
LKDHTFALETVIERIDLQFTSRPHPHLVYHLACFDKHGELYRVYEKFDFHLAEYMERNKKSTLTDSLLIKQLWGLAEAIDVFHGPCRSDFSRLDVPFVESSLNRSLHLLNPAPDRIQVFVGRRCLFRIMPGHSSGGRPAKPSEGGSVYRAPESSSNEASSWPAVIFSLGCMYLELIVWHLDGYNALLGFRDERTDFLTRIDPRDGGFFYNGEAESSKPQLRESVKKMIQDLRTRCQGSMIEVVEIVNSMLCIEPTQRPTASKVGEALKQFVTDFSADDIASAHVGVPL